MAPVRLTVGLIIGLAGCDAHEGTGVLRLSVYGEELIENRLGPETVADGWTIVFSRFMVALPHVEADGMALHHGAVIDLTPATATAGHPLGDLVLPAGAALTLSYRIGPADADAHSNATPEDLQAMADAGASMWIQGTASRGEHALRFDWSFDTRAQYSQCDTTEVIDPHVVTDAQLTLHGDHLFYDDLDSPEPNVSFDLISSADADGDGNLTAAELLATDLRAQSRYQVGGRAIDNLWAFIAEQSTTLGHINGEGHCEARRLDRL